MRRKQIVASAILSVGFLAVYGTCNWITAHRVDVGTLYFEWERRIPLVPIFIIPYMSIDAFFVLAPFLFRNEERLRIFSRRIGAAILIAGISFLVYPLKFGFDRPAVPGPLGVVFRFLHEFDQPYNMLPSLHIVLRTILADAYRRQTIGALRSIVQLWFCLVGFSTIFTYQHHVPDIIAGFIVAPIIFYLIPSQSEKLRPSRDCRIGAYYAILGISFVYLAVQFAPVGLVFAWPAIAVLIVAAGYWGIGPAVFRKTGGEIPFSARLLLAPYCIVQYLYLQWYVSKANPWDEIVPGLIVGRVLTDREAQAAIDSGVTAVVDMTSEFSEAKPFRQANYLNLQTLDLTAPAADDLKCAVEFIRKNMQNGKIYLHCKLGYSRSAAVAGAYLIEAGIAASVDAAIAQVRNSRPGMIVRPEIRKLLLQHYPFSDTR